MEVLKEKIKQFLKEIEERTNKKLEEMSNSLKGCKNKQTNR